MESLAKKIFLDKGKKRKLSEPWKKITKYSSAALALYLLYSNIVYYPDMIILRSVFVSSIFALCFIWWTMPGEDPKKPVPIRDILLAVLCLAVGAYILINGERFVLRYAFLDPVLPLDYIFGTLAVLLTLEATRRTVGPILMYVGIIALAYAIFGNHLSGLFAHPGFPMSKIAEMTFMTTGGIYGSAVGVACTYVFLFCIFGALLTQTGAGEFFFDLSTRSAGGYRGGLAKVAVVASALFGSISGSPISNVATTGNFTIPAMKKSGYPDYIAAATETAASCGGTILPPVMGSVAFVMAEVIGWQYRDVLMVALLPGLLYYLAVMISIDSIAVKFGLIGLSKDQMPKFGAISVWLPKVFMLVVPIVWLVYRIMAGLTATRAAGEASLIIIVASLLVGGKMRINFNGLVDSLATAIKDVSMVGVACAGAGIIMAMITLTGAGAKFTSTIMLLSDGKLILSLLLTALITVILGMGMSITPTYILASSLACPGLIATGVSTISAHMFVVYFAAMATMTPPVALAAYTAAGIAGSDPMKTGLQGFKFGLCAYIIPFVFVYRPEILLQQTGTSIMITMLFVTIGVIAMSFAMSPVFICHNQVYHKLLLGASAVLLYLPNFIFNTVGIALLVAIIILQFFQRKKGIHVFDQAAVN
ncbi:MAG: TRAP transporter fused permease subunit [Dehalobacterium sp.]